MNLDFEKLAQATRSKIEKLNFTQLLILQDVLK